MLRRMTARGLAKPARDDGSLCARPRSSRIMKAALRLASGPVLLTLTVDVVATLLLRRN